MSWEVIITILGLFGGLEGVKWLMNRTANAKQAEAEAEAAEIKAEADEFHLLRERLEFSDRQMLEKEQRFQEQTLLLRETNKQLIAKTTLIGELNARIAELEAERKMKLCERRGCAQRQPQSGF